MTKAQLGGKKGARLRRARRVRAKLKSLDMHRLGVHRTPQHIYAQLLTADGSRVVASASSLDPEVRGKAEGAGKLGMAALVGRIVAERAQAAGIKRVAFDRSGFKYHGRVKALAEAAREQGLEF